MRRKTLITSAKPLSTCRKDPVTAHSGIFRNFGYDLPDAIGWKPMLRKSADERHRDRAGRSQFCHLGFRRVRNAETSCILLCLDPHFHSKSMTL